MMNITLKIRNNTVEAWRDEQVTFPRILTIDSLIEQLTKRYNIFRIIEVETIKAF